MFKKLEKWQEEIDKKIEKKSKDFYQNSLDKYKSYRDKKPDSFLVKSINLPSQFHNWTRLKISAIKNTISLITKKILITLEAIQKYPIKQKISDFFQKIQKYFKGKKPKDYFNDLKLIVLYLAKFPNQIKKFNKIKFSEIRPEKLAILGFCLIALSFLWTILLDPEEKITISSKINEEKNRKPSAVEKRTIKRSPYYLLEDKQFKVFNHQIPVTGTKASDIRHIMMDYTLITSNRFIPLYLKENPHIIQDSIYKIQGPVTSDFPLSEEGHRILKETIIDVINDCLKERNIEGEIRDIKFQTLNAY